MIFFRPTFRGPAWPQNFSAYGGAGFWSRLFVVLVLFLAGSLFFSSTRAAVANSELSTWRIIDVPKDATNGLGPWIWAAKTTDKQFCQFWHSIQIPSGAKVSRALLKMTVDNWYRVFLDGRELGQGTEWRALTQYDITLLLAPGTHTLAVIAFNDFLQAGMILGLRIELLDGRVLEIQSDESWRIVPNEETGWELKKKPAAEWPTAKIISSREMSPLWWVDRPLDFATVAPLRPIIIPLWHRGWFQAVIISVTGIVFLVCLWLMAQLVVQNKEHRLLNLERARIARDIHDDVGTRLTQLVLQGEVVQSTQPANSEVRRQLDLICEGLRGVLGAMDEVLWAVNPRHDTLANFIAYICDYAQNFLQNTKIQCRLEVEPDIPPLDFDLPLRRSLLLVVKEALNNAAKHSDASQLFLKIYRAGSRLAVVVEDNGRGFDLNHARKNRNGLTNMFQRMSEAGGECQIATRPGEGCRVEFSIPLTGRPARHWFFGRAQPPEPKAHFIEHDAVPPGDGEESNKSIP